MSYENTNRLEIRTAEGVSFSLELAGPVTRFIAWAIDAAAIGVVNSILMTVIGGGGMLTPNLAMAMATVVFFVFSVAYAMIMEWFWRGQTLGKRVLRLRVSDAQGLRLQFSQIAIRNLLRAIDFLPLFYCVGGIAMLLNRNHQRLGDLAANTIVTKIQRPKAPDFQQVLSEKYNSFRDHPQIEARLRQQVSAEEAAILVRALMRREQLEPAGRVALYEDLADHFKSLAAFPEETTMGLTDEQYLRNLVDTLFRETQSDDLARQPG